MKPTSIFRFPFASTCTPERLAAGKEILRLLYSVPIPKDSALCVARETEPKVENLFIALRHLSPEAFFDSPNHIRVPSPMRRNDKHQARGIEPAFLLPKKPYSLTKAAVTSFFNASEENLLRELAQLTGEVPSRLLRLTEGHLFAVLEATVIGSGLPPALAAVANFIIDTAQPEGVTRTTKSKQRFIHDHVSTFPAATSLNSKLSKTLKSREFSGPIFAAAPPGANPDDEELKKVIRFFANDYLPSPEKYRASFRAAYRKQKT
jgi:hypothetical protein